MPIIKEKINNLFVLGTEFFGLDLKYFSKAAGWVTFSQIINGILAFVLTIILTRLLPKETYGLYRYVLSLADILTIFTLTGMNSAVVQAVAAGNEGALIKSVKHQLKWNLMMTAASFAVAIYYFLNHNLTLALSLFIIGALWPITLALNTYPAFLIGKKNFRLNSIFNTGSTLIYVASMLLAVIFTNKIPALIFIYSLATLFSNLIFYFRTIKIYKPKKDGNEDFIVFGWKLSSLKVIGIAAGQIDNIIMNHFFGPAQLAIYALARILPDNIIPLIKDTVNTGMPNLAQKTVDEINKIFYKRIIQSLALGIIASSFYSFIAPTVFKYLLPKYLESVYYSQILSISFVFLFPLAYMGAVFISQKLTRPIFIGSTIENGTKILLYIGFGVYAGILGLILAQVIIYFISFWLYIIIWRFYRHRA